MSNIIESLTQNLHGYSAQKMNSFPTDDGIAWSAEIIKDGRKVLYAFNRGDGGETCFNVLDQNLFKDFESLAKSIYPDESVGQLCGLIADSTETVERIKLQCKTHTLIEVKGDEPDTYRIISRKFDEGIRAQVVNLFGNDLICFLNEKINNFL